jgi:hypothetical protein
MMERIKRLLEDGLFGNAELNKLGHGSFLDKPSTGTPAANAHLEEARSFKREADAAFARSRSIGARMYMEALFSYIRGYLEEEVKISMVDSIYHWKGLAKFVGSVIKLLSRAEEKEASFFRLALFNIKFHYLHLEGSVLVKQNRQTHEKDRAQLLYFLREFSSLDEIFALSELKEFSVVRLENLEWFIKNRAEFVERPA